MALNLAVTSGHITRTLQFVWSYANIVAVGLSNMSIIHFEQYLAAHPLNLYTAEGYAIPRLTTQVQNIEIEQPPHMLLASLQRGSGGDSDSNFAVTTILAICIPIGIVILLSLSLYYYYYTTKGGRKESRTEDCSQHTVYNDTKSSS